MKYILPAIFILLITGLVVSKNFHQTNISPEKISPTGVTEEKEYAYFQIKADSLSLINNWENQVSSDEIIEKLGCISGINGGFYGEDKKPLGWVVIDSQQVQKPKDSELLNGYVYVSNNKFYISDSVPAELPKFGLQSGPLLIKNGKTMVLKLAADKPARRSVAVETTDGKGYMVMFLGEPTLKELPETLENLGKKVNWSIKSAINLDGGTASAFENGNERYREIISVGSWWCQK